MSKFTERHMGVLQDESADPFDRGWAIHLIGVDGLRHHERLVAGFLAHPHPFLRNYALEALLRWGRSEYLDLAIAAALESVEPALIAARDVAIEAVGTHAVFFEEGREKALSALATMVDDEPRDENAVQAYALICEALGEPIPGPDFERSEIDQALIAPLRKPVKPATH